MADIIILGIIVIAIAFAVGYIVKAKRSGKKCIGCPYSDSCGKKNCELQGCRDK